MLQLTVRIGLPLALGLALAACGGGAPTAEPAAPPAEQPASEEGEEQMEEAEEEHEEEVEAPAEFEQMTNPFAGDSDAIAAGEALYAADCAACHGEGGQGDGPAAANMDPAPTNLADPAMLGDHSDGYVYWRIAEGGAMEPFNSAMPGWKDTLSEDEIWQLVSFVRSLSE